MTKNGALIVCYHRIAEGVEDPFRMCVSPEHFATHLEEISRSCEPSTLDDLSHPSRRLRVVVTFDDGYGDNLGNALPIAESKGVPLTIFVPSCLLGGQSGFWWDRLGVLLRSRPRQVNELCLTTTGETVRIPLGAPDLLTDLRAVRRHLLPLSIQEIEAALHAVSEEWSVDSTSPSDARPLTPAELRQLAVADVVTIGAHTVDHVQLRGRKREEQLENITASRKDLEEFLGRNVSQFAYPFGRFEDFDDNSVEAVRSTKFDHAVTAIPGLAKPSTDPYRLPRRGVMDWGRVRFRAQLRYWALR